MQPESTSRPGSEPAAADRLAGVLAAALDCIVTVDDEGRILEFNPAAEATFGYRAADVLGRQMADLIIPPAFRARHHAGMKRHVETGKTRIVGRRLELCAMRADGSEFPCELTITRLAISGRPVFTAFVRDITSRKEAEARLQHLNEDLEKTVAQRTRELREAVSSLESARERLERAQSIARVGDVVAYPDNGERFWSRETFRLYGLEPAATPPSVGEVLARVHPADQAPLEAAVRRALAGSQRSAHLDYRVIRPDGSVRWLRIVADSDIEPGTGRERISSTIRDVTEEKKVEHELQQIVEKERELGKLKSDFLHMITHEYRTPLAIITSSAEILERYHDRLPAGERAGNIAEIRRNAKRLANLVEEVLFLGKAEAGTLAASIAPLDIAALVREVTAEVVAALGVERDLRIDAGELPPGVSADATLLRHILSNLIGNALKYSTLDKPVSVSIAAQGDEVLIRVRDEGIGIPEADLGRLFQMFHRASNVGAISGTGLGLAVVKRCADLHGATVEVRSAEGKGSEFTVRLPLVTVDRAHLS